MNMQTEPLDDEPQITHMNYDGKTGSMEIGAIMPNVCVLAAECTALLEARNAKNYVEFDMVPRAELGIQGYRVTVQRMGGKSPAQRVNEMEREVARLQAQLAEMTPAISMQQAQDLIVEKFALADTPKLRHTTFGHVYPNTSGPLGGVGGQAMTTFLLDAWFDPSDGYAVIFYGDKVLKVMGFMEFETYSTYRG